MYCRINTIGRCAFSVCLIIIKLAFTASCAPLHTMNLPLPKRSTDILQASLKRSPGRLQTRMRPSANLSVNLVSVHVLICPCVLLPFVADLYVIFFLFQTTSFKFITDCLRGYADWSCSPYSVHNHWSGHDLMFFSNGPWPILTASVVMKRCAKLHIVVGWSPNDTATSFTVIPMVVILWKFSMAPHKAYKKSAFRLFWTLLKNKVSMK